MASLGSEGKRILQKKVGLENKASAFYDKQMLDYLNPYMREFILKQEMFFIATADSKGECDCSFRAGKQGFVRVLNKKTLLSPRVSRQRCDGQHGKHPGKSTYRHNIHRFF